jgi:hypothetical protein
LAIAKDFSRDILWMGSYFSYDRNEICTGARSREQQRITGGGIAKLTKARGTVDGRCMETRNFYGHVIIDVFLQTTRKSSDYKLH